MGIEERELVAPLVEPYEVPSRVHKAHHELPHLLNLPILFDSHLEEVHLRFVAWAVDERDEHLGLLTPFLPKIVPDGGAADLIAFFDELPMDPGAGDTLLGGGAPCPLREDLLDPRSDHLVPRNRGKNTTLLTSMSMMEGLGPSLAVEGATNDEVFETFVEQVLAPGLRRGQVVVLDNLSAHKGERVKELIEGRDCEVLYLPPYSPDLNSIEEAFSKIKGLMRKAESRSREALVEAILGTAISALSAQDACGFFEHCGYRAAVQSF